MSDSGNNDKMVKAEALAMSSIPAVTNVALNNQTLLALGQPVTQSNPTEANNKAHTQAEPQSNSQENESLKQYQQFLEFQRFQKMQEAMQAQNTAVAASVSPASVETDPAQQYQQFLQFQAFQKMQQQMQQQALQQEPQQLPQHAPQQVLQQEPQQELQHEPQQAPQQAPLQVQQQAPEHHEALVESAEDKASEPYFSEDKLAVKKHIDNSEGAVLDSDEQKSFDETSDAFIVGNDDSSDECDDSETSLQRKALDELSKKIIALSNNENIESIGELGDALLELIASEKSKYGLDVAKNTNVDSSFTNKQQANVHVNAAINEDASITNGAASTEASATSADASAASTTDNDAVVDNVQDDFFSKFAALISSYKTQNKSEDVSCSDNSAGEDNANLLSGISYLESLLKDSKEGVLHTTQESLSVDVEHTVSDDLWFVYAQKGGRTGYFISNEGLYFYANNF